MTFILLSKHSTTKKMLKTLTFSHTMAKIFGQYHSIHFNLLIVCHFYKILLPSYQKTCQTLIIHTKFSNKQPLCITNDLLMSENINLCLEKVFFPMNFGKLNYLLYSSQHFVSFQLTILVFFQSILVSIHKTIIFFISFFQHQS